MYARFALLVLLGILLPHTLVAQRLADAATGARAVSPLVSPSILDEPRPAPRIGDVDEAHRRPRNYWKGALYGAIIGAVVGGVGLAAASYAVTTSSPRNEYVVLSLLYGGTAGSTVGALVGVLIGVPERRERSPESATGETPPHWSPAGGIDPTSDVAMR